MTRAFGDEKLKEHITSEPDIFVKTIDSDTQFIILASDGLWKVSAQDTTKINWLYFLFVKCGMLASFS